MQVLRHFLDQKVVLFCTEALNITFTLIYITFSYRLIAIISSSVVSYSYNSLDNEQPVRKTRGKSAEGEYPRKSRGKSVEGDSPRKQRESGERRRYYLKLLKCNIHLEWSLIYII